MARRVTLRDQNTAAPEDAEDGPNGGAMPRRKRVGRKRRQTDLSEAGQTVELGMPQVRRLLEDFVPESEEPADLDDLDREGISPVEERMRARSNHPGVVSVPDAHNSVLVSGKTALLTPCQEIILARRIENGDQAAKEALINSNLRLVTSIAQRYQGRGVLMEDLMQEGIIGLVRAADKFNWRRGFRFSTYATHWIRQAIMRAIANSGRSIRLPAYIVDTVGRLARVRGELENDLGRQPTRGELAQAVGMSEHQLTELLQNIADPVSLSTPLGEEGDRSLADVIPAEDSHSPSARVFRHAIQEEVQRALKSLTPREQQVLELRFGLRDQEPHTLEEVGRALHITRERARQLEGQALEKLRHNRAGASLKETLAAA